jgi:hypothetical protein
MNKNLTGRQGTLHRKPLKVMPPVTARGEVVPASRANLSRALQLPWMRERAERLHRICKGIERQRAKGVSVRKACTHLAWVWKDRSYRTAPHIKCRFSRSTLVVLYYHWRRNGKSPGCFALHYSDRLAPLKPADIRRFLAACGKAGTVALSQAAKLAGFDRAKAGRVRARLPRQLVDQVKAVFKERRKAELAARAAVKQFRWKMRLRLIVDAARGRKINRLAESFIGRRDASGGESTSRRPKAPIQATGAFFKRVPQEVTK